jgi:hypothetical protein
VRAHVVSFDEKVQHIAVAVDYGVDDMSAVLQRVLADPAHAAVRSARGLERAKNFTWEECVRRTLATLHCGIKSNSVLPSHAQPVIGEWPDKSSKPQRESWARSSVRARSLR